MFEPHVRHQCRRPAWSAAADFFAFEVLRLADVFSGNQRLQRAIHGTCQDFACSAADDSLNDTVYGCAVVDIAAHECCVDRLRGHKDDLQIDSLLAIEALMISDMKRQKADIGRLDSHPDFSHRLSMSAVNRENGTKNQEPKKRADHVSSSKNLPHYSASRFRRQASRSRTLTR